MLGSLPLALDRRHLPVVRTAAGFICVTGLTGCLSTTAAVPANGIFPSEPPRSNATEGNKVVDPIVLLTESYELTVTMKKDGIPQRQHRLKTIAILQAAAHRPDLALKTLDSLGSEHARIAALKKVAFAQARMGQLEDARQTQVRLRKNESWLYEEIDREIGVWQARNGHVEEAVRTARGIRLKQFAVPVLTEVALQQANAGNASAVASISEALRTAESIDESQRAQAWLGLVRAQKAIGGQDVARQLLEEFLLATEGWEDEWAKVHIWREAAFEMQRLGDAETAIRLFARAVAEVPKIDGGVVHGNQLLALKMIAVDQARLGLFQVAFATLERMEIHGVFDASHKEEGLRDIALAQIERGDLDSAMRTALLIREFAQYRDDALLEIAMALTTGGNAPKGVATCEQIQNNSRKAEALLRIAILQALNGDRKAAVETAELTRFLRFESFPAVLPSSDFAYDRSETWGRLYEPSFTAASSAEALDRACALGSAAIRLQVALGRSDWATYPEVCKEGWDDVIYAIARGQTQAGDAVGAVSWTRVVNDPGKKAWAFVGIADAILEKQGLLVERN
jgi:tetratricopeptide (TPR) repeat protein